MLGAFLIVCGFFSALIALAATVLLIFGEPDPPGHNPADPKWNPFEEDSPDQW